MRHRFPSVVILLAATLFVSAEAPFVSEPATYGGTDPAGLVAHEWGTFTSVAGQDGFAEEWVPPQGPRDLPVLRRSPVVQHQGLDAGHRSDGNAGHLLLLARGKDRRRARPLPPRPHHGVVSARECDARQHRDAGAQESCARGNDCVESGESHAASGGRVPRRERRESLLRGAQDRCVAPPGGRPAGKVSLLSRDRQLSAAARRHAGRGRPRPRQHRAGTVAWTT